MRRSGAGCASGSFFGRNGRESAAPGAASSSPGRRAVEFCWAIRRPSTRTMRTRIAALSPKDAVAVPSRAATAACLATWAGGLLFGVDGVAGLRFRHAGGCLPRPRDRLGRRDSPGFDQGPWFVPSCPVNPEGFKRPPRCRVRMSLTADPVAAWRIRLDSPLPPPMRRHGASVPTGCISPCDPQHLASRVAWHLGVASRKLRLPRPCRTSTGRLSSSLSGVTSRQRGRGATNGRRQITPGTKAAPEKNA